MKKLTIIFLLVSLIAILPSCRSNKKCPTYMKNSLESIMCD